MTPSLARLCIAGLAIAVVATSQDGMRGVVRTIDGRTLSGVLVVAEGKAVVTTDAGVVAFDVAEMTSFARADAVSAPATAPHRVWLRSGLELPAVRLSGAAAAEGKPSTVVVETPSGVVVEVPLASVRAIRHGGAERPEPALFANDLSEPPSSDDLIYVIKDGKAQRSVVTVTALTKDRIDFRLRGDGYEFELAGLAAVVFGTNTGFPPDRQPKPRTRLQLTTGERIEGRLVDLGATGVRCRLDEGALVEVPAARLLDLQVASDRLAWLSEMKPAKVEQTPAFDRIWPWSIDRTPAGAGLLLGGKQFGRGLCLVPKARLSWDLAGRFDVFEAVVGIDDRGGPDAHAILRVLVDGQVAWDSGPRTRGQAGEAIRVELKKCKTLAIEVDFGKNYDLGDYCVFADARVVQQ